MATWTDTINDATDWSAVAFINMFVDAVAERCKAANVTAPTAVSAGDDVQRAANANFSITYLQSQIDSAATKYVPTTLNVATLGKTDNPRFTTSTFRAAAGLHADGWRRKRPREISSLSASTDTQGNSRATNQRALYTDGLVYKWDGAAWTADPLYPPDVLDSDSAAPDHVAYGTMQVGDYIGPWLFNELRDACNVLLWVYLLDDPGGDPLTTEAPGRFTSGSQVGLDSSWAAAKAYAEGVASSSSTSNSYFGLGRWSTGSTDGAGYYYLTAFLSAEITPEYNVWRGKAASITAYVWAEKAPVPPAVSYDDDGLGIAENAWTLIDTTAASAGSDAMGTVTGGTIGDESVIAWCDEPDTGDPFDGTYYRNSAGFEVTAAFAIAKYDVTNGFAYRP